MHQVACVILDASIRNGAELTSSLLLTVQLKGEKFQSLKACNEAEKLFKTQSQRKCNIVNVFL